MFECVGQDCPGCSSCDPLRPVGSPPMKNVTPRKPKTKPCALCAAPVAKRDEAIIVGPHVACLACAFPHGHFDAVAATDCARRVAQNYGFRLPAGFSFK